MSLRHHVPADIDAESVAELSADCASLSPLCPSEPLPPPEHWQPHPVPISDQTRHLIDGMSDYGD